MGRGRAKAKQTKVARQLKYGGPSTDLQRLQAELSGTSGEESHVEPTEDADENYDLDDPYAQDPYAEDDDEADDD